MINSVFYCGYSESTNVHRRAMYFSEFENLISHHMHMRTGCAFLIICQSLLGRFFASSRQNEVILCNRIKGKHFGLCFQGKVMFINHKEESMVARIEKNQNPAISFQIAF